MSLAFWSQGACRVRLCHCVKDFFFQRKIKSLIVCTQLQQKFIYVLRLNLKVYANLECLSELSKLLEFFPHMGVHVHLSSYQSINPYAVST